MPSTRSLWFESHLLSSAAGKAAQRHAEALGPAIHERILARGDRLAQASIAAAQQFYRHAAAAHAALGADFERWVEGGTHLAEHDPPLREAAAAYFEAPVAHAGIDALERWASMAIELAAVSRKLTTLFGENTAPLLDRLPIAVVEAWAREGRRLHGQQGWHGEFLAQAYFAAAERGLFTLAPAHFGLWTGLGAALRKVMKEGDFFSSLSPSVGAWTAEERTAFLQASLALAVDAPAVAAAFYRGVPETIDDLDGALRLPLLRACALAGRRAPHAFGDIVPVLGALVQAVPSRDRAVAVGSILNLAERFPRGVPSLLRTIGRAFEETDANGVRAWIERGVDLAAEAAEKGLAFFALESRTSVKVLRATSTGVDLDEVQGVLRKLLQMYSGQSAVLRGEGGFYLRPPLEELPGENEVAVPSRVEWLATHEDNESWYRVVIAQLAARRGFDTYDLVPDPRLRPNGPRGSDLVAYLRADEKPELVEELFTLADGFRTAQRMIDEYPGLSKDYRWAAHALLRRWAIDEPPMATLMFDCALAVALSPDRGVSSPAWLTSLTRIILPAIAPLARANATAADALAVAEALATRLLEEGAPRTMRQDLFEFGGLMLEKVTGDALIDPYFDPDDDVPFDGGEAPRQPPAPPPEAQLELPEDARLALDHDSDEPMGGSVPLSAEELKRLLESGADLKISQAHAEGVEGLGLFITDLVGKLPSEQIEELRRLLGTGTEGGKRAPKRWLEHRPEGAMFLYDEWDYHIDDYRSRWCTLREIGFNGDSGLFFNETLSQYSALLPEIRRQFQRIRPEMYRIVRGLEDGEDFDLNAAVDARVETRARRSPSQKLYVARKRQERDVATLFLLDMSASTDEPMMRPPSAALPDSPDDLPPLRVERAANGRQRRIIDVAKEALVIMAEALDEIGDAYAIYGFSGHGRENVEFYMVKSFSEQLTAVTKGRIGGIEPKRSTRMGTALRHAIEKMSTVNCASKHLILLSDGFPQDFDYGQDRRSNTYGIRDTTMALREAEAAGITPFCITVDKAGHDYLREMCDSSRYMVIEDIGALPKELPKIYQRVTQG